ncbi:auxin-responsive protein SAUR36-like [Vigna unguiculata]|uniref:SAUR family protein n=1 Tax=Vigna unguiculata TaxID=3917 RepID=A0A4D6KYB5_VIGUN|nr:auxin-responsive protein SAUR36-like [Vigna unguiculata]QCD81257.1 SAUR family protein [Vigna unguiculata]
MVRKSHKNSTRVVLRLVWCFRQGTNKLCLSKLESKYAQLGNGSTDLPKGHLTVCVGESEDEKQRVLVPVTHFNHPLLGKLLEDAEKVYGFDYPGVITIPCTISEFQRVQNIIATTPTYNRPLTICCFIN